MAINGKFDFIFLRKNARSEKLLSPSLESGKFKCRGMVATVSSRLCYI